MPHRSLVDWAETAMRQRGYGLANHHRLLINELEALGNGGADRLMVQMPPGSAKSTYASVLFPAWWLAHHPRGSIITASHTAGLSARFGRQVRSTITDEVDSLGYSIAGRANASAQWWTASGGEYYAVGIRGAIIGRRADIAIIDDPVKSQYEADSGVHRERLWDWYRSDLVPRLKPKASIVLIMTRWHQDDLCGRILTQDASEWRCIRLPAFAEAEDQLGRVAGEALWPDWEDSAALLRRRAAVGERAWWAQFQQSPRPQTGTLFRVERLHVVDTPPVGPSSSVVRAWDLAATSVDGSNDPDWTVGVKLMRLESGRFVVLDVLRFRGSPGEVDETIARIAKQDGRSVPIGLPEDPGQAGKSQVSYMASRLAGYNIRSSKETGSKVTRANPVASQVEFGNLAVVRSHWTQAFIDELQDFPYGRKDDQVDALSRAFGMLVDCPSPAKSVTIPHMTR